MTAVLPKHACISVSPGYIRNSYKTRLLDLGNWTFKRPILYEIILNLPSDIDRTKHNPTPNSCH